MSKRDQALALFAEEKTASSPEIKSLELKGNTKYNYYAEWQKHGGASLPSPNSGNEAKGERWRN